MNTPIRECIRENLEKDPVFRIILKLVEEDKTRQFWVDDSLLWAKGVCLYIPRVGDLQRALLK